MTLPDDPFARFTELFSQARAAGVPQPEAMALATSDAHGSPSVRMVLLKSVDDRGFVFYTNMESRKGVEIQHRPAVSLCFFWEPLERQVRVEGLAHAVDPAEADAYFASRPRGSQVGAWASQQSRRVSDRAALIQAVAAVEERYRGVDVPRPAHWTGLRVVPSRIEFWHGRPDRLHERVEYVRTEDTWRVSMLQP